MVAPLHRKNLWRSRFPAVLGWPKLRAGAATLLLCSLLWGLPSPVRCETITRRHLDAGRVQYSGIDLNGDAVPDVITQDNIRKTLTYFFLDKRRNLQRIGPLTISEDERRAIPDVLTELDLDGDEVRDLVIYNREYLRKYAENAAVFARLPVNVIYIGQAKDTYRDLDGCVLSPEARMAIVEKARESVLRTLRE